MSLLRAPANLPDLVRKTFSKALRDAELDYFPSQVTILTIASIPLRFSAALANKPKAPRVTPQQKQSSRGYDPFANPPAALFLSDIGTSHLLILNKFAVVPEHFILATKEFKPQTHVLEPSDLEATAACIRSYQQEAEAEAEEKSVASEERDRNDAPQNGLFAFFNCGDHSGASQPHRHIQLLPIARMRDGLATEGGDTKWNVLAENLEKRSAPFVTFSEGIHLTMSGPELFEIYLKLYRQACRAVDVAAGGDAPGEAPSDGETRISYNMAMTKDTLVICPRLREGGEIKGAGGEVAGTLALNGTLLAGTALVKTQAEWDALRGDPQKLRIILREIGIASSDDADPESVKL